MGDGDGDGYGTGWWLCWGLGPVSAKRSRMDGLEPSSVRMASIRRSRSAMSPSSVIIYSGYASSATSVTERRLSHPYGALGSYER